MRELSTGVIDGRLLGWDGDDSTTSQVFVPGTATDTEIAFELRRTEDDRLALPVYRTIEDLVRCCGAAQAWIGVYADRVEDCAALCSADLVVWDAEVTG
ncbi:SAV_915 family protein [Actinophytocola sediminis]